MDAETLRWAAGIGACMVLALIGAIYRIYSGEIASLRRWRHETYPADIAGLQLTLITLRDTVTALKENRRLAELEGRMHVAEEFIVELRDMKHNKVDPYLPRAFDDLHRRVAKLESK